MKKELFKKNILVDEIGKTSFFKIIIFLSIITAFYGLCLVLNNNDFFSSIIYAHSVDHFNMVVFMLIFLNTVNNCRVISKNYNFVIRLQNRKNYVREVVKTNFLMNLFWIVIFLLMFFTFLCLTKIEYLKFYTIKFYSINIVVYTLFYLFRYYLFILFLSTIACLIYIKFKEKNVYIFMIIFIFGFLAVTGTNLVVDEFQILPWKYFYNLRYSSFLLEVCFSVLYCIILEIVIMFLYKLSAKKEKVKIKELYFLFSDIEYFIRKNKLIILLYFMYPVIVSFTNKVFDGNYILRTSLGLNIDKENLYIVSVVCYITNICCCMYVFIQSFIKDYSNVSNIYLRYNHKVYYFVKSIINIILVFLLKLLQYGLLVGVIKIVYKRNCSEIGRLFINDLSLVLFLGFLVLLLYVFYKIFKKSRFVICILFFIYLFVFIINPLNISKINYIYFMIGIIGVILIMNSIIVKFNKKVIQEIGGV